MPESASADTFRSTERDTDPLLHGLTESQARAVLHTEGPLLVLAAAGSGKTLTITRRVAHLIAQGNPPWSILALTFTNKAATEMRERIERLIPPQAGTARGLVISTFHAFCARLLRRYAERVGLNANYTIYDAGDQRAAIKEALDRLDLSRSNFPPDAMSARISNAKNAMQRVQDVRAAGGDFWSKQFARVYEEYEKTLRQNNAVDFDDLLLHIATLLRDDAEVRGELRNRFRHVLIDEYQDTNHAQFLIADGLAAGHRRICVVGDPDQCLLPDTLVDTTDGEAPIRSIVEGQEIRAAAGWGKTGRFRVEKVLKRRYRGPIVVLETEDGREVRGTPNHIGFARVRPNPDLHFTYLMWKRGLGYRLGTTRGVRVSKDGEILSGLQVRTNQEVADAVWIVRTCTSSADARFHEHLYSVRYGLPTLVFFVRGRRMDLDQTHIDRLYGEVDTHAAALRLMHDLHLDLRYPHHRPGAVTRQGWARRHVFMTLFGGGRCGTIRAWHEHRVQLVTSDPDMRQVARENGLRVRGGTRGTWRIETSRKDSDAALQLAQQVVDLHPDMELIPRARLTDGKAFQFMPLSHIHPGMIVATRGPDGIRETVVARVRWEDYEGDVFDLSIPDTRNFIAGGIVVHNSIYGWRGADISNILEFQEHYPEAEVVKLGENFRSTAPILHVADHLIKHNVKRKDKPLFTKRQGGEKPIVMTCIDEHHEAEFIANYLDSMNREHGLTWKDMAVFYRTNALSRNIEAALRERQIPHVLVRGTAFYDRKEIRDALAYLRVILNPGDSVSLKRIINEPARGIGKTTVNRLEQFAAEHQITLVEAIGRCREMADLNARAVGALERFGRLIESWRGESSFMGMETVGELAELVRCVVTDSGMEAALNAGKSEEDAQRLDNLNELVTAVAEFEEKFASQQAAGADTMTDPFGFDVETFSEATQEPPLMARLRAYLEQVALVSDVEAFDPDAGAVTLMTLHAAKGLEFPVVVMIGIEENLLPHSRSRESDAELEEERRLAFVGITRAKQRLVLTHATVRSWRGLREPTVMSRFLGELPDDGIEWHGREQAARYHGDFEAEAESGWAGRRSGFASPSGRRERSEFDDAEEIRNVKQWTQQRASDDSSGFSAGCRVRHPLFGDGQVESVTRTGRHTRVRIRFREVGTKTLIAEYARLERLS